MAVVPLQLLVLLVVVPCTIGDERRPKVLILGGGLAGLRAGQVLQKQGVRDFLILEADSKLGGRFLSPCLLDVPACVNEIHIEQSLPSPHPISELFDTCNIASGSGTDENLIAADEDGRNVTAKANAALERLLEMIESVLTEWKLEEDDMDLESAARLHGWRPRTPVEIAIDVYMSELSFGAKPSELSTHMFVSNVRAAISDEGEYNNYFVKDSFSGSQDILNCLKSTFLTESDERVKLNTKVTRIQYTESGVIVTASSGNEYAADYAIVTFSLGVLQQEVVTFVPALTYSKRKAINKFSMSYTTAIYSQFSTRIDDWVARSNQPPPYYINVTPQRNVYHFFYDAFETIERRVNHSQPYNLFVHWTVGDDAVRVETQDINKTKAELTNVFRQFFGASTPEPEKVLLSTANTNPLYYGSYAIFPSGATKEDYDKLREPLGRVFFAGDAYYMTASLNGATRALYSGNETAMAVIECMNGGSCAMTQYGAPQKCP